MLNHQQAKDTRERFLRMQNLPGSDDSKAPNFYKEVLKTNQQEASSKKIGFIVVAHFVHTLPYFLEALAKMGDIVWLISKQSQTVEHVHQLLNQLYKSIIMPEANKDTLTEPEKLKEYFASIFQNKSLENYQLIIIDHGGYFATCFHTVLKDYESKILGVVEHTLNGENKYHEVLERHGMFVKPVFSIATSYLKDFESEGVAKSIIDATGSEIYSGRGFNQDLTRLNKILVIGYGHIGSWVAYYLKKRLGRAAKHKLFIADTSEQARDLALRDFDAKQIVSDGKEMIPQVDLIVTATSRQALSKDEVALMKSGVCIVCATSSDDQLTHDALDGYEVIEDLQSKNIVSYQKGGKIINLAAGGGSINFLIGSTSQPILHAVLASVCVNAQELIFNSHESLSLEKIYQSEKVIDKKIKKIYEKYYGPIINQRDQIKTRFFNCNKVDFFIGRQETLQEIEDSFQRKESSKKLALTVIVGMPGVGKSTVANKHLQQIIFASYPHYDWVLKLKFPDLHELENNKINQGLLTYQLISFCQQYQKHFSINTDNLNDVDILYEILNQLNKHQRILIYFDNVDSELTMRPYLQKLNQHGLSPNQIDVLMTSQSNQWMNPDVTVVPLPEFTEAQGIEYIQTYYLNMQVDIEQVKSLYKLLGGLPIAMEQAVAYLNMHKKVINIPSYIALFEKAPLIAMNKEVTLPQALHELTLSKTLSLIFTKLIADYQGIESVLEMIAVTSNYVFISEELLEKYSSFNGILLEDVLKALNHFGVIKKVKLPLVNINISDETRYECHSLIKKLIRQLIVKPKSLKERVDSSCLLQEEMSMYALEKFHQFRENEAALSTHMQSLVSVKNKVNGIDKRLYTANQVTQKLYGFIESGGHFFSAYTNYNHDKLAMDCFSYLITNSFDIQYRLEILNILIEYEIIDNRRLNNLELRKKKLEGFIRGHQLNIQINENLLETSNQTLKSIDDKSSHRAVNLKRRIANISNRIDSCMLAAKTCTNSLESIQLDIEKIQPESYHKFGICRLYYKLGLIQSGDHYFGLSLALLDIIQDKEKILELQAARFLARLKTVLLCSEELFESIKDFINHNMNTITKLENSDLKKAFNELCATFYYKQHSYHNASNYYGLLKEYYSDAVIADWGKGNAFIAQSCILLCIYQQNEFDALMNDMFEMIQDYSDNPNLLANYLFFLKDYQQKYLLPMNAFNEEKEHIRMSLEKQYAELIKHNPSNNALRISYAMYWFKQQEIDKGIEQLQLVVASEKKLENIDINFSLFFILDESLRTVIIDQISINVNCIFIANFILCKEYLAREDMDSAKQAYLQAKEFIHDEYSLDIHISLLFKLCQQLDDESELSKLNQWVTTLKESSMAPATTKLIYQQNIVKLYSSEQIPAFIYPPREEVKKSENYTDNPYHFFLNKPEELQPLNQVFDLLNEQPERFTMFNGQLNVMKEHIQKNLLEYSTAYQTDFINLLLYPIQNQSEHITIYPAIKERALLQYQDEVEHQYSRYGLMPVNVLGCPEQGEQTDYWLLLMIDKQLKVMYCLDPAINNSVPLSIQRFKEALNYTSEIALNSIAFIQQEHLESNYCHSGVYVLEMILAITEKIMSGKFVSGVMLPLTENELTLETAFSVIRFGDPEDIKHHRGKQTNRVLEILEGYFDNVKPLTHHVTH